MRTFAKEAVPRRAREGSSFSRPREIERPEVAIAADSDRVETRIHEGIAFAPALGTEVGEHLVRCGLGRSARASDRFTDHAKRVARLADAILGRFQIGIDVIEEFAL